LDLSAGCRKLYDARSFPSVCFQTRGNGEIVAVRFAFLSDR